VRYPEAAQEALRRAGIAYAGWLPNHHAPKAFARSRATVHVPRQAYTRELTGIPTIRVFEALACGIPLVCSPWSDTEKLFPGDVYLTAANGEAMKKALRAVTSDAELAKDLSQRGLAAIRAAHTCAHRVDELLAIVALNEGQRPEQNALQLMSAAP
jgi:spore maturation protein CgeB